MEILPIKGVLKLILTAALKIEDEHFEPDGFLVLPCIRHGVGYSTIHNLVGSDRFHRRNIVEGFIDTYGTFYTRIEAMGHAIATGQLSASTRELKGRNGEIELYSEDLY